MIDAKNALRQTSVDSDGTAIHQRFVWGGVPFRPATIAIRVAGYSGVVVRGCGRDAAYRNRLEAVGRGADIHEMGSCWYVKTWPASGGGGDF